MVNASITRLVIVDVDPSIALAVPALLLLLFGHFVYMMWDR